MKEILNLVHRRSFYSDSNTRMSSLYNITSKYWERWDWGNVEIALEAGQEVHIRPATLAELGQAHLILRKIKGG